MRARQIVVDQVVVSREQMFTEVQNHIRSRLEQLFTEVSAKIETCLLSLYQQIFDDYAMFITMVNQKTETTTQALLIEKLKVEIQTICVRSKLLVQDNIKKCSIKEAEELAAKAHVHDQKTQEASESENEDIMDDLDDTDVDISEDKIEDPDDMKMEGSSEYGP